MNLVFRVVFWIIIVFVLMSLSYSTFFMPQQNIEVPDLVVSDFQNFPGSWWLYHAHISKNESLFSTHEIEQDFNQDKIHVPTSTPGIYISSFRDMNASYEFSWTWYLIEQEGIWEMYIDTQTTPWKVFVYTKNTPARILLQSDNSQEIFTHIYLAPGMYIEFQASRWKYLKNADRLRISTVYKLGYLESIKDVSIDPITNKYFWTQENEFIRVMSFIWENDLYKQSFLKEITWASVYNIPGIYYIQRYFHLFVNKQKKVIFYKNSILDWYISLLNSKVIDQELVVQIKKDEQILRSVDPSSYSEMLVLRSDIVSALNSEKNSDYIIAKLWFSWLLYSGLKQEYWLYPLYSYSLFSWDNVSEKTTQSDMKRFFDSFASYTSKQDDEVLMYDYFLYFLEKRLLYALWTFTTRSDFGTIIETLSYYSKISQEVNYTQKNQKITQLYSITKILQSIDAFMRTNYFMLERGSNNLLLLQSSISISWDLYVDLQNYLNTLYDIYDRNKNLLNLFSNRDKEISEDMLQIRNNIDEYVLAIGNYEKYKDQYDISNKNILNTDVIGWADSDLSEEKARAYISQFTWTSQWNYSVEIIQWIYYRIENLIISAKVFSFDIYPYSGYRMKNISIDGRALTTEYTLENIKQDWDEKLRTAIPQEKNLYDFSRFFLLTFLTDEDKWIDVFEKEIKTQEPKAEIVFKRDILLGNRWEFSQVKSFLDIEYEDISLQKVDNNYDIFLSEVDYDVVIFSDNERVSWKMNSQYVFSDSDHYFKNIQLFIASERIGLNNTAMYELWLTPISISGNIYLLDMQEVLKTALSHAKEIMYLYDNIYTLKWWQNLSIQYTASSKKTRFKFDSNNKTFTILLQNNIVTGIFDGTIKLNSSSVKVEQVQDYLP